MNIFWLKEKQTSIPIFFVENNPSPNDFEVFNEIDYIQQYPHYCRQ